MTGLNELFLQTLAAGVGPAAFALAAVVGVGVAAQWIAWRVGIPSILILLVAGFAVGPGWTLIRGVPLIDPDERLGDMLLPLVGAAVGIILYEGGLTLRFREIASVRNSVLMLVSVGALATWGLSAAGARYLLGLPAPLAILLGAVLIVTGPTVIGPLLQHVRPSGAVGPILKWEGIVIDPIGALAAVLVLEVLLIQDPTHATGEVALAIGRTLLIGGGLGAVGAVVLVELMARYWIPEPLQNPVSLALVVAVFTLADAFQSESGLLATTVMGIWLANQKRVDIRHILEFKENLRVLLISTLFVVLAARIQVDELRGLNWVACGAFLGALIFIIRPAAVIVSTIDQGLTWRERTFLALMAPRGIVAAAVSSVFALSLQEAAAEGRISIAEPGRLVPLTFSVIVGTVLFYSIASPIAARVLKLSDQNPGGVVVLGASDAARALAGAVRKIGPRVLLIDTNRANVTAARLAGMEAAYGNVLDDLFLEDLDLRGIGRAVLMTPNSEVNTLAAERFARLFGKARVFAVPVKPPKQSADDKKKSKAEGTRRLGGPNADLATMEQRLKEGWVVKATTMTADFDVRAWRGLYGPEALLLATASKSGIVELMDATKKPSSAPGSRVIGLVNPDELLLGPIFQPAPEETTVRDIGVVE